MIKVTIWSTKVRIVILCSKTDGYVHRWKSIKMSGGGAINFNINVNGGLRSRKQLKTAYFWRDKPT